MRCLCLAVPDMQPYTFRYKNKKDDLLVVYSVLLVGAKGFERL